MFWQIVNMIQIVLLFICWLAVPIMVYLNFVQFLILFFDFSIEILFIQLFTIVLIDAVNEGINEGCDLHEDSNGGVNWFGGLITTTPPSHGNTPLALASIHGTHGTHDDHGNTEPAWASTIGGDGNTGSTLAGLTGGSVSTWATTGTGPWIPGWTGSTPTPGATGDPASFTYPPGWTGPTLAPGSTWNPAWGLGPALPPGWTGSTPVPGESWTYPPGWTGSTPNPMTWPPGWTGSTPVLGESWTYPPGWTGSTPNMDDLQKKLDEANNLTQEQLDQLDQAMDNANDLTNQMAGDANDLANQLGDIASDTMNDANDLVDNLDSNMDNLFGKKRKKRDTTDDLCSAHEDNQVLTYFLVENKSINILTPKTPYHPLV